MIWKNRLRRLLGQDLAMDARPCYSQDGEDLILDRLLDGKRQGFYIDVGAHHPARFSNTYLFYLRGWRGINVDAQPGSMRAFDRRRPRDINIECGVGVTRGVATYYQFNEPALNTFSEAEMQLKNKPPYCVEAEVQVQVRPLAQLLQEHLPVGEAIDFLSVDVEGKDLEVLQSNDWSAYRPRFVLAETLRTELLALNQCPVVSFMAAAGYGPVCKAYNTTFFERRSA
jgi:FkbM family methyltransferase